MIYSLADELGIFEEVLAKEFPKAKRVEVSHLTIIEKMRENARMAFSTFFGGKTA